MMQTPRKRQSFVEYKLSPHAGGPSFVRPSMHKFMLEDFYRIETFRNGLLCTVQPGMNVLEIGMGTGILSVFALQAFAQHVFAIEVTDVVQMGRDIIRQNHWQDKITVLHGHSSAITLPARADLLVSETLGHLGFDEGILETAHDARERLLTRNAPILPSRLRVLLAPVMAPDFMDVRAFWRSEHYGVNFRAAEPYVLRMLYVTHFAETAFLADVTPLCERILGEPPGYPLAGTVDLQATQTGVAHGLGLSFDCLIGGLCLVSRASINWQDVFMPFESPLSLTAGDTLRCTVSFAAPADDGTLGATWQGHVLGDPTRTFQHSTHAP